MEYERTIAGKQVTLKQRLPLRDGRRLPGLMQACGDGDLQSQVAVLALVIESWEFPGNPADVAAYQELDVFTEFVPIANWVGEQLQERLQPIPKP